MVASVSPDWTSYVSPPPALVASVAAAVGVVAATTAEGEAAGDARAGRCGLGAGCAPAPGVGAAVGVGAAAVPPQAVNKLSISATMAVRREPRSRRMLASP